MHHYTVARVPASIRFVLQEHEVENMKAGVQHAGIESHYASLPAPPDELVWLHSGFNLQTHVAGA